MGGPLGPPVFSLPDNLAKPRPVIIIVPFREVLMGTRIKSDDPFCGAQLKFPVKFELKLFMNGTMPEQEATDAVKALCASLSVKTGKAAVRPSQGGKYYCLTLPVTVDSKDTFDKLFAAARTLPGVKMVL